MGIVAGFLLIGVAFLAVGAVASKASSTQRAVTSAATTPAPAPSGTSVVGDITSAEVASVAALHGWTGQQIADWVSVIKSESNGTLSDTNSSSGAYGIAQFINGPSEYAQYGGSATSIVGQLTAMANYIAQRYGNPSNAWAFHQAHNYY